MKIRGTGGDATLDVSREEWGDSISVALSEPSSSAAVWTIEVYMQASEGRYYLGRQFTVPPALGGRASRIVAIARCPGAKHWWVRATASVPTAQADIRIAASKTGGGGQVGVYAPDNEQGDLSGPAPAAMTDSMANPSVSKIGAFLAAYDDVSGHWARLRQGALVHSGGQGWLNTLAGFIFRANRAQLNDGDCLPGQINSRGALFTVETDVETVVFDLSFVSPAAAGTVAGPNTFAIMGDLAGLRNIEIRRTIQGATGGALDIYLRSSEDTTDGLNGTWADWARFTQQTAGLAATTRRIPLALTNVPVAVGTGTQTTGMALAADTYVGGHPGKCVAVVAVAGAGTSVGAAQNIKLIGTRPRG